MVARVFFFFVAIVVDGIVVVFIALELYAGRRGALFSVSINAGCRRLMIGVAGRIVVVRIKGHGGEATMLSRRCQPKSRIVL